MVAEIQWMPGAFGRPREALKAGQAAHSTRISLRTSVSSLAFAFACA
jgi:hypothetical protein